MDSVNTLYVTMGTGPRQNGWRPGSGGHGHGTALGFAVTPGVAWGRTHRPNNLRTSSLSVLPIAV